MDLVQQYTKTDFNSINLKNKNLFKECGLPHFLSYIHLYKNIKTIRVMKITLQKGQKLFFTSDTHFHHKNICEGLSDWDKKKKEFQFRPFNTLEELDKTLVENINSIVGENDILIHLGDWSFGGIEQVYEFRRQIKCKNIHLTLGNHDHHIENNKNIPQTPLLKMQDKLMFSSVNKLENLTISIPNNKKDKDGNQLKNIKYRFVICHFPLASWDKMGEGIMHLHGHIHTPTEARLGPGRMMDVGIDGHPEFRPYELNEILNFLKNQPIKGLLQHKFDHH